MKASELRGGTTSTVELKPTAGTFAPRPAREEEVQLLQVGDELLLRGRAHTWVVEPASPSARAGVTLVIESGMPRVCWVASAGADTLSLQVHSFPDELRFPDPMEVGVDERIAEDLRRTFGVGGPMSEIARWLDEQVWLEGDDVRRAVIAPGRAGSLDAFRIFGRRITLDVRRDKDRLRVERVTRGGSPTRTVVHLLRAPLSFRDATVTAAVSTGARLALEEAVRSQDSYLRVWVEYNSMEEQAILRRARAFGAIPYTRAERRPRDGGWTFHIADTPDLDQRLRGLGEDGRTEIEAASQAPDFETTDTPSEDEPLSASLLEFDMRRRAISLCGPEEDEEQPRPPTKGYLFLSLRGDRTRLGRRKYAEEQLRTGTCPMPWLGLLLEGRPSPRPNWRRRIGITRAVREAFGGRPTVRQAEAVEVALNTPDVALIQGPPGTGKTKVITALQRRIAELADEGVEVSHRILVTSAQHDAVENVAQRSEVFGLPAIKVGSRRGDDGGSVDGVEKFRADRIEALRAELRAPPDTERIARGRRSAVAILGAPVPPRDAARHLRELLDAVGDLLTPAMADRIRTRAQELTRPTGEAGDPEASAQRLDAARALSFVPGAFFDGGPVRARKALVRLGDVLRPEERSLLEACASWTSEDDAPPYLPKVETLRAELIDRLSIPPAPAQVDVDEDTQRLLCDAVDELDQRRKQTDAGDESVLAEWLHDLDSDHDALRSALEHYTAVLAATLQQAAGKPMRVVRGIDTGSVTFETVIVDEAARSNPLDLFIPLTMAKRRVVLVGDHQQLPHMLEPDVERELTQRAEAGDIQKETVEAVKHSLFQRLWNLLRQLEDQDGVRRTVTLDTQFRMHPVLGDFVSRMFYERWGDGRVASGGAPEAYAHKLPGYSRGDAWAVAAWLDVPGERGTWEHAGRSKARRVEARALAKELRRLIEEDLTLTFGVIAFYRAQVDEIGEALIDVGLGEWTDAGGWRIAPQWRQTTDVKGELVERLRVGTVDAFQGKEFDVVFLSVTRSNDLPGRTDEEQRRKYGHLMLDNRLCVAMSRQHRLLIAVGDLEFVRDAEPLLALREFVTLCEGKHGVLR